MNQGSSKPGPSKSIITHVSSCIPIKGHKQDEQPPPEIRRITFSKNEKFMVVITSTHAYVIEIKTA